MSMEEKKVIKKKKKKKGARTAVILALVLASGVGGAFLWKQKKAAGAAKTFLSESLVWDESGKFLPLRLPEPSSVLFQKLRLHRRIFLYKTI